MVADLWQRQGKISCCFKNSAPQCQNRESFQRKVSGKVVKFSPYFFKGEKYSLMNKKHRWPFKRFGKNFDMTLEPFH